MARGFLKKQGKIWYGVFPWQGKKKWVRLSHNKKDAERMLAEIMRDVHAGAYKSLKDITFTGLADKWYESRSARLKGSTMHGYKTIIKHLKEYFGDSPVDELRADDIENYILDKIKEGKLSNKTIGYHLGALKAIFKQAMVWGYLSDNPAQHITRPRAENKEIEYLSADELKRLLDVCPDSYYPFILTAATTGMRWGEITELRWKDFNENESTISVTRSVWEGNPQEPKSTSSIRKISIPKSTRDLLFKIKEALNPNPDDLIFSSRNGTHIHHSNFYRDFWNKLIKDAQSRPITFHGLRHTYATVMLSNGASLLFVSRQLGHRDIQTTLRHYGHVLPQDSQIYVEEFERLIFGSKTVVSESKC